MAKHHPDVFIENLEKVVKSIGDLTEMGRNYHLGYITALKDEEIITEREFKVLADIILWHNKEEEVT